MLQPSTPVVSDRTTSTPWYSGVSSTSMRITSGKDCTGANVPENRNSANWATIT